MCIACQASYIVKHFLIEYRDLALIRRFTITSDMKDLFENDHIDDMLSFLKKIKLFQRLWT